jgi:hypothetical protein
MSVGNLVDTGDFGMNPELFTEEALEQRWAELGSWVEALPMPFFFAGGNNEFRTEAMEEVWAHRLGPTYYHFLYQDVLFIVLNSEEPPGDPLGGMGDAQLQWLREILAKKKRCGGPFSSSTSPCGSWTIILHGWPWRKPWETDPERPSAGTPIGIPDPK